jgi:hypothetical protein
VRRVRRTRLRPLTSWRAIERRESRKFRVGDLEVGGDAPICVQSMTNTLTADAPATIAQLEDPTRPRRRRRFLAWRF